jgi:hypothetical protein
LTIGYDIGAPVSIAYSPGPAFWGGRIVRIVCEVTNDLCTVQERRKAATLARACGAAKR